MKKGKRYVSKMIMGLLAAISVMVSAPEYVQAEEGVVLEKDVEETIEQISIDLEETTTEGVIVEETQEEVTLEDVIDEGMQETITTEDVVVEETTEQVGESESDESSTSEPEEVIVNVKELDLGDYLTEMVVGDKQLLSVTVIPLDATEQECMYKSSNDAVASINGMGRIHAHSIGETTITVSCGNISSSFVLKVIDSTKVLDIEIANHEEEIFVDDTMILSATVIPSDVIDAEIKYSSSDISIATVSSQGEVKGISKGQVIIYVSAGGVIKEVPLVVKVSTTKIKLNNDYLILKPGDTFQLSTEVTPKEAEQKVTYKVLNTDVAEVSAAGLVKAKEEGSTSIFVSNSEITMSVSVIVNTNAETIYETETVVTERMMRTEYPNIVDANRYPFISSEMLYYFYNNRKELTINGNGYQIKINGAEIKNHKNTMYTDIQLATKDDGIHFNLNKDNFLCGPIQLTLKDVSGKYLYLYNESKNRYEVLQADNMSELVLTTSGKYLITQEKIDKAELPVKESLIVTGVIMCIMLGIYIGVKKQYWFW